MKNLKKIAVVVLVIIAAITIYSLILWKRRNDEDEATFKAIFDIAGENWMLQYVEQSLKGTNMNMPNNDWYIDGKLYKSAALMEIISRSQTDRERANRAFAIWYAFKDKIIVQNIL